MMASSEIIWVGVLCLLSLLHYGECIRRCKENTDCESLGDLLCIKSMCTWGICGCERGHAARFVGSTKQFQCVEIKRIGEKCSTDDTEGVCGAGNSRCLHGKCECDTGYESRWGGENCLSIKSATFSESCSTVTGLGTCDAGSGTCQSGMGSLGSFVGEPLNVLTNSPFDEVPNACACAAGQTADLSNDYDAAASMGKTRPICRANRVGDLCLGNADCGLIQVPDNLGGTIWVAGSAECINNQCACPASQPTYKSDISGLYCAPGLDSGNPCAWSNSAPNASSGVCDGSKGLRCGDPCDIATLEGSGNHTCKCDPGWKGTTGTCSKQAVGDTCYGDYNCKSLGLKAVCRDGLCESSASVLVTSATLSLLAIITYSIL